MCKNYYILQIHPCSLFIALFALWQANDSSKAEVIVEVTSNASALTATDITATVTELETLLESAAEDEQVRAHDIYFGQCLIQCKNIRCHTHRGCLI